MTLKQLLETLQTGTATVVVIDLDSNEELVSIKASGFANLDDALEAREVKQWFITGATSLKVVIESVAQNPGNNG